MRFGIGPVLQTAYVVRDLDEALTFWTEAMGVGPFYVLRPLPLQGLYKGEPTSVTLGIALGFSGEMQIELIEQISGGPSPYRGVLNPADGALQSLNHVGVLATDVDRAVASLGLRGFPVVFDLYAGTAQRIVYLDTAHGAPGGLVELLPQRRDGSARTDRMREAARSWQGENPVRSYADL